MSERTEIRDGVEFTVTRLPSDKRLQPAQSRKRAVDSSGSFAQNSSFFQKLQYDKRQKRRRKKS